MLSVLDLIQDPEIQLEVLVASDLSRQIRWVHVTELVDPSEYLNADALILSAGVWGPRGARADTFIDALVRCETAALGWGLLDPDGAVPESIVRRCRRAGLTLLSVPTTTSFITISQRFVERLQQEREAEMRASIARNSSLIRALSGGSSAPARILDQVRAEINRDLWLGTGSGRILAASVEDARGAEPPAEVLVDIAAERARVDHFAAYRLYGGPARRTYVLVDVATNELGPEHDGVVEQALPFLEFALSRQHVAAQAERRLAAELIDVVLAGQNSFATARLNAYGLDPDGTLIAVAIQPADADGALITVRRMLGQLEVDAVVADHGDALTAIVQLPEPDRADAIGERLVVGLGEQSAIGMGSASAGVDGLRRSIVQAREAAMLARRSPSHNGWARYDQLTSHSVLLALQDEEILRTFHTAVLGPLEAYDARRETDLVGTLEAFLDSGCQWQVTADHLHLHVNTLRHRLQRCEQLTGRRLASMADRVDFYIALRSRRPRPFALPVTSTPIED